MSPTPAAAIVRRCWAGLNASPLMLDCHDREWGVPLHGDRELFAKLVLDGFQAGLSWSTILNKRAHFLEVFDGFDPERMARYDRRRIEKLLKDPGIVRNRQKVESARSNARAFLEIQELRGRSAQAERAPLVASAPGADTGVGPHERGAGQPRLPLRRADDLLRVHAGGRDGQRSSPHLLSPRGAAAAGGERQRDEVPAMTVLAEA